MPLPLHEILDVDAVRRGQPRVVAAADKLDAPVRWVHAAELADIGLLLRGGELLLSTGIALPSSATGLAEYVAGLAGAGVAGLAIELGRRFTGSLPPALITACEAHGLPLIAFEREVPFVEITEAVHVRIIDAQFAELRAAHELHEVFTALSVSGAPAQEIIASAARLAGRRVILADLSCRVLAVSGGPGEPAPGFAEQARAACEGRPRTFWAAPEGWLVTTVGAQGEDWGRLFLDCSGAGPGGAVQPPSPEDTVLVERAAATLALGRLLARQAESLERHAHRTLLSAIIEGDAAESPGSVRSASAEARARAMGVPVTGRQLVGLVARIPDAGPGLTAHAAVFGVAEAIADACRDTRVPALVGTLDELRAGALLSLPPQGDTDATLRQVGGRLEAALSVWNEDGVAGAVVGVGAPAGTLRDARRSLLDAREVADVALRHPDGRAFYRLPDLRLRGLLHLLRDDARLRSFADRELGPLLEYDAAHGTSLLGDLSVYLQAGGNKAVAAERAHLARPTFYQRLRLIERVLGVSLADPESRVSLHAALLTLRPDELPASNGIMTPCASLTRAARLASTSGGFALTAGVVPIPLDCSDGFNEAYYGRPEALLEPAARLSCSAWSFVGAGVGDRFTGDLTADLADGTWDRKRGHLRTRPTFDGSLILVTALP